MNGNIIMMYEIEINFMNLIFKKLFERFGI